MIGKIWEKKYLMAAGGLEELADPVMGVALTAE